MNHWIYEESRDELDASPNWEPLYTADQMREMYQRGLRDASRAREAEGLLLYIADTVSRESLGDAANMLAGFLAEKGDRHE